MMAVIIYNDGFRIRTITYVHMYKTVQNKFMTSKAITIIMVKFNLN